MSDDYKKIINYLAEYVGEDYIKPENCKEDLKEKWKYRKAKNSGQKVCKIFNEYITMIATELPDFIVSAQANWRSQPVKKSTDKFYRSKMKNLQIQLKKTDFDTASISLSFFAEKINDKCQFRIAVEINDDAKKEDWEKYNKLVDIPLEKGLVYTIRDNRNKNTFKIFDKIDNKEAKKEQDKGYKMQVAYIIDNPVDDDDLIEKLKYYSKVLVKYYNYILTGEEFLVEGYPSKEEQIEEIEKDTSTLSGIERETLVKARVNQGVFRDKLLVKYKSKCCLCEVNNECLLVASHIKPWAKSEANEKLDDANGLLLCPNHDKLFDLGFISFDDDGNILISDELSSDSRTYTNVRGGMQIDITKVKKEYLAYHRDKVFKKI